MTGLRRIQVLQDIDRLVASRELNLARQGESGRDIDLSAWDHSRDIDYWASSAHREEIARRFREWGGYILCRSTSRCWLNHDVYVFPCGDGPLQVDVTIGDLMVGPLILAREQMMLASLTSEGRLSGLPLVADLLLRPLARGKRVSGARLEQAVEAWRALRGAERDAVQTRLSGDAGAAVARACREVLEGTDRQTQLSGRLRRAQLRRAVSSYGAFRIACRKLMLACTGSLLRWSRPFGRYHKGLLVAFVGTDGVGKSSSIEGVREALAAQRSACVTCYLGRGRGNLPGLDTVRNAVGRKVRSGGPAGNVYRYPVLNKLVTWYYVAEYCLRLIKPWWRARLSGQIVLCDRYFYDLALIPGHSRTAVRVSRGVLPRPDVIVMLEASARVIHSRKQERTLSTIEQQQQTLREIVDGGFARGRSLALRTDELSPPEVADRLMRVINPLVHPDFD